jgi:hypothetical protein
MAGGIQNFTDNSDTNFDIVNRLYGGPQQSVDGEDLQDLLGAAAIVALETEEPASDVPEEETPTPLPLPPPLAEPAVPEPVVPIGPAPGLSPGGGGSSSPQLEEKTPEPPIVDTGSATSTDTSSSTPEMPELTGPLFTATTTPPALSLTSCAGGFVVAPCVTTIPVDIEWSAIEAAYYEVLVNGMVSTTTASSTLYTVPIVQGANTVQVIAYDYAPTPSALSSNTVTVYGWPVTGIYCSGAGTLLEPGGSTVGYNASGDCYAFGGFAAPIYGILGKIYKGTVGSSTLAAEFDISNGARFSRSLAPALLPGETYFVLLWEFRNSIGDIDPTYSGDFDSWLRTGVWLDGVRTQAPPLNYKLLHFTYDV